jgi:hypothetical protein
VRAASAAVLCCAGFLGGCSVVTPLFEPIFGGETASPPPRPAASTLEGERGPPPEIPFAMATADDAIVRVVAPGIACSGTLVNENLVLTAHHCVADRNRHGTVRARDVAPGDLRVELGGDYLPWGEVGVRSIVSPPCGYAAGVGDIAVLVLERSLDGAPTLETKLDQPPELGQHIHAVGFGRCALSADGIRRRARVGGAIETLLSSRYQLEASICPGDSGGPGLDPDGNVVGVISASAMDGSEDTRDRAEFTRLDAWRSLFSNAKLIADGAEPSELPPIDGC